MIGNKPTDETARLVGKLIADYCGKSMDEAAAGHLVKPETVVRLKACLPALAQGVAEACPGGIPEDDYSPIMIVIGTNKGCMSIGLKDWPTIDDDFRQSVKQFNNADLWAALADAAERGDPLVAVFAFMARLGPDGFKEVQERYAKCAKDGFTPVVLILAHRDETRNKAAGFCTVSYLPARHDEADTKH